MSTHKKYYRKKLVGAVSRPMREVPALKAALLRVCWCSPSSASSPSAVSRWLVVGVLGGSIGRWLGGGPVVHQVVGPVGVVPSSSSAASSPASASSLPCSCARPLGPDEGAILLSEAYRTLPLSQEAADRVLVLGRQNNLFTDAP